MTKNMPIGPVPTDKGGDVAALVGLVAGLLLGGLGTHLFKRLAQAHREYQEG